MNAKGLSIFVALTGILLPLLSLAFPIPVHAANITVSPTSGVVGTSILINGGGFAGRLATIHWDDQIILKGVPISGTGELTCSFKIPTARKGSHIIKITDDSNWASSTASATFTVVPAITIFPHIVRTYTTVTVIGNGFAAFERNIKLTWDGNVLSVSADANHLGTWGINLDITETTKGDHFIDAFGSATSASEVAEVKFTIGPVAKVEPVSGPVGTEIKIDGFGFRIGEDGVTINWDGEIILCNIVAKADGSWSTPLNIPPSIQGHHTIGVYGSSFTPRGIVPDTIFNVVPHIELQPASGNKGTKVTVIGTGFAKNEAITIRFDDITLDTTALADNEGSFNATFEVPQSRAREHKVTASGRQGNSAQAKFITEKTAPPTPQLLSPKREAKLEIFSSVGDVFLGTTKQLIGIIAYPRDFRQQSLGTPRAAFDWSDINNKGKVSYILQIARGDDFSSPALIRQDLTDSEYAISKGDILTKGSYTWRVKAVDDVGNESSWSDVWEFEVIPISNQVLILSLIIPVIFIAVVAAALILTWRVQKIRK